MEWKVKRYKILLDLTVKDGCFVSQDDLLKYVEYRMSLRSRGSDAILLHKVELLNVTNDQLEFV